MPDIFNATKDIKERVLACAGLSDILADARIEGFSAILRGKYTVLDERTRAEKTEYREAMTFMLDGRDILGHEDPSRVDVDETSLIIEIGRLLRDEIRSDVEEFYERANINEIDPEKATRPEPKSE